MVGTEGWQHWGLRGSQREDVAKASRAHAKLEENVPVEDGGA